MSAQVEFFCSAREEQLVLGYLTKAEGTRSFDIRDGRLAPVDILSSDELSNPNVSLAIVVWQPAHGSLIWHTSRPEAAGPTHASFLKNYFARQEWESRSLSSEDRLLDDDLSPVLLYKRGGRRAGRVGPNTVLAPPSNLERVGPEYKRWANRCLSWVRRHGRIVHDWRTPSKTIPNPDGLLNTIYALPDVQEILATTNHEFGLFVE